MVDLNRRHTAYLGTSRRTVRRGRCTLRRRLVTVGALPLASSKPQARALAMMSCHSASVHARDVLRLGDVWTPTRLRCRIDAVADLGFR